MIEIDRLAQEVVNVISAEDLQDRKSSVQKPKRSSNALAS
jgi:hypothetical protein